MDKLLEELWYTYEMEHPIKWNEERKQITKRLTECENKLLADLTDEQKERLESFQDCTGQLNSISEKEAYIKGVRFATAYLLEALNKTDEA